MNFSKLKEEKELAKMFKIFGNKYKLAVLKLLKQKGEKSVGQIADDLEIPFNTVSKYLLQLARQGLLTRRYDTPFVLYKIPNSVPEKLKIILSKIIC